MLLIKRFTVNVTWLRGSCDKTFDEQCTLHQSHTPTEAIYCTDIQQSDMSGAVGSSSLLFFFSFHFYFLVEV